jgi:hypothetical protein
MHALDEELAREDPTAFSEDSQARLWDLLGEYAKEIGLVAIRRARRNGSDVVSAVDIEGGDRAVRSDGRGRAWPVAFGGVLSGAGIGTFLTVAIETHPSILGLSISAIIAAAGLITMTAGLFGRER